MPHPLGDAAFESELNAVGNQEVLVSKRHLVLRSEIASKIMKIGTSGG